MVLSTRHHLSFSFFYHDSHETDTGTRETRGVSGLALVRLIVRCRHAVSAVTHTEELQEIYRPRIRCVRCHHHRHDCFN